MFIISPKFVDYFLQPFPFFHLFQNKNEKDVRKKLLASVEFAQLDRTHRQDSCSVQLVEAIRTSQNTTYHFLV